MLTMPDNDLRTILHQIGTKLRDGQSQIAAKMCRQKQIEMKGQLSKYKTQAFSEDNSTSQSDSKKYDEFWELESLRGVCLAQVQKSSMAIQILLTVLDNYPHHTPSMRRLGSLFKQKGNYEKALEYFKLAQLYQPDNKWLSVQIQGLEPSQKKQSSLKMVSSFSFPEAKTEESSEKQHVTFGSSEVVQLASEHSDEYFAHIKKQINNISESKPKKSILKTSSGTFYKEANYLQWQPQTKQEEEQKDTQIVCLTKSLSIKSCGASLSDFKDGELGLDDEEEKEKKEKVKFGVSKKEKKKKKGVSFSFTESSED